MSVPGLHSKQQYRGAQNILDAPITTLQERKRHLQGRQKLPELVDYLNLKHLNWCLHVHVGFRLSNDIDYRYREDASQAAPYVVPTSYSDRRDADTRSNGLLEGSNGIQSGIQECYTRVYKTFEY